MSEKSNEATKKRGNYMSYNTHEWTPRKNVSIVIIRIRRTLPLLLVFKDIRPLAHVTAVSTIAFTLFCVCSTRYAWVKEHANRKIPKKYKKIQKNTTQTIKKNIVKLLKKVKGDNI